MKKCLQQALCTFNYSLRSRYLTRRPPSNSQSGSAKIPRPEPIRIGGGQARRAPLVTLMSVFVSVSGLRVPIVMYSVTMPFKTCFYSLQFVTACLRCPVLRTVLSGREEGGSQA